MNRWHGLQVWTSFLCVVATATAQVDAVESAAPKKPVVVILGASVSGGFSDQFMTADDAADREHNLTVKLAAAIAPWFADDAVSVRDFSNFSFFQDPPRIGRLQVDRAVRAEPDLVLAIDFMFWFGYSLRGGTQERRLALQRAGLEQLARIDAPLLVGDYPEMGDVDPRMMGRHAVPDADTLRALNEELRTWAKTRPNVRVLDLAQLVEGLRTRPREVDVRGTRRVFRPLDLLQTDRLHATRLGMAVLVEEMGTRVRAWLPETAAVRPRERTLPQIVEALALEDLAATTPAAAESDAGKRGAGVGRNPAAVVR